MKDTEDAKAEADKFDAAMKASGATSVWSDLSIPIVFKGFKLVVTGYRYDDGRVSILKVDPCDYNAARLAQLLSIKPERDSLLADIEYQTREEWWKV